MWSCENKPKKSSLKRKVWLKLKPYTGIQLWLMLRLMLQLWLPQSSNKCALMCNRSKVHIRSILHWNLGGGNLTLDGYASLRLLFMQQFISYWCHKLVNHPIWQQTSAMLYMWLIMQLPPITHTHTYKSPLVTPSSGYQGLHCEDESCMLKIFGWQHQSHSQSLYSVYCLHYAIEYQVIVVACSMAMLMCFTY